MASLASLVTISARQNTRYTECAGCGMTGPLPRHQTHCQACQAEPQRVTRGRTPRAA